MIDYFKIISTDILPIAPKQLETLAKNFKNRDRFSFDKSTFIFPPKDIFLVIELFLSAEFDKINFFDILTLSLHLKKDNLEIQDKREFIIIFEKFFSQSPKYIQNLILNTVGSIYISQNSFKDVFRKNLKSKEFLFIKLCVDEDYSSIQRVIKNKSIKKFLQSFTLNHIFSNLVLGYSNFLLNEIFNGKLDKYNVDKYKNNLLLEDDLKSLYNQVDRLITFIEEKRYTEEIYKVLSKLGNIEDINSKWNSLKIDASLQDRYKRLKGLFEFQRFVKISNYLITHTDLSTSNLSKSGKTSDANRIENRSTFWSNYDERFSSVKMWVSESDYHIMNRDKPIDLKDIRQLENINNDVCMLEFKENNLLIIEFFRLRDNYTSYKSLMFIDDIEDIKLLLEEEIFDSSLYERLKRDSNYEIHHDFLWQGWVDEFLRRKNIYPNESILNGKLFDGKRKMKYTRGRGLLETRNEALSNYDREIRYEDVILCK